MHSQAVVTTARAAFWTTARAAFWPVRPMVVTAPIICFAGALLTDITYAVTANIMWSDFSDWLLAIGMALGVIAFIATMGRILSSREPRARGQTWPFVLGGLITLAVAFVNNLVHSRDAWTSVVPMGLALSVLTIVLILATGWLTAAIHRRHAMQPEEIR